MLTAALAELMASQIATATHVSLHTDAPGETGANEVSGGSPAYARVAITAWTAGSSDGVYQATLAGSGVFNVPADTEVLYAGLWNGSTFMAAADCIVSTADQSTITVQALLFVVSTSGV